MRTTVPAANNDSDNNRVVCRRASSLLPEAVAALQCICRCRLHTLARRSPNQPFVGEPPGRLLHLSTGAIAYERLARKSRIANRKRIAIRKRPYAPHFAPPPLNTSSSSGQSLLCVGCPVRAGSPSILPVQPSSVRFACKRVIVPVSGYNNNNNRYANTERSRAGLNWDSIRTPELVLGRTLAASTEPARV